MTVNPDSKLLEGLKVDDVVEYLHLSGWNLVSSPNTRWVVFQGVPDINNNPIEIVLLRDSEEGDKRIYLSSAVNILSTIAQETPAITVEKIQAQSTDTLRIRNVETGSYNSISIGLAAKQVPQLRKLVAFSANSEHDPRPFFQQQLSIANKMVNHYRFGHTFAGSFGFTVKSHLIDRPRPYRQLRLQYPEEDDIGEEPEFIPIERRVMERIVRGLLAVQAAESQRDISSLVQAYAGGFNANMCTAIVDMSRNRTMPLEFNIMWSPKVRPSGDVEDPGTILLNEMSYTYLARAAEELRNLEKDEPYTVRGLVRGVSSTDDPLASTETQRSVVIRWTNRPYGERPVNLIVYLDKTSYLLAHDAHIRWQPVLVEGIPKIIGNNWRLLEPRNFRILDE